jgi:plasmid stabilization system protein ParE
MRYQVDWSPQAENDLAALWLDSTQRDAITRAAHEVDQLLRIDAHQRGESRTANSRILFEVPLGVIFHADEERGRVLVVRVWISSRRIT